MKIVYSDTHAPYEAPSQFVLEKLEQLNLRALAESELHEHCALMAQMIDPETGEYLGS